uniref:Sodium-coupled neutral amino acid symporter 2 n=1 Tax=Astyanax mexicanus TaxID=7994 RepID=A0A8B9JBE9_ASTMX
MSKTPGQPEMSRFNISPDEDSSCSSNSNDYQGYQDCTGKKGPIGSQYADMDAENQNFLPHYAAKKKYEAEYHPGTASFGMSVFNLGNAIMGSGILGLSYAMANTGIALFVILLVAVSIFSLYSVHLLLKTANEGGSLVYEQLGYKAFGMPGKLAASCSITMQNIGGKTTEFPLCLMWYTNGDYLVMLVSLIIILPLSLLKNLGKCFFFFFSITGKIQGMCYVIYKTFQIPCPLPNDIINMTLNHTVAHNSSVCTPKYFVFNSQVYTFTGITAYLLSGKALSMTSQLLILMFNYDFCISFLQTVYAVPILTFAFVCHPAILPMYEELKDRSRKKMQGVANVSFLAMFIMYLLAALFGYLTFNDAVESELLHTYSKVYKFDVVLLIVRLAVLTAVTLTVPVVLFPIRTSVNQLLCASKEFSWIRHTIITVILLACVNVLVIFVPTIRDIFGFIGASAAAMLIFILPSAFYIKLVKKEPMMSVQKIGACVFLASGFLVMFGSMTLIVLDWIHNAGASEAHGDGH